MKNLEDIDLVLQHRDATYVFLNEAGSLTIKQSRWPDDDVLVVIPIRDISAVIKSMRAVARDAKEMGLV